MIKFFLTDYQQDNKKIKKKWVGVGECNILKCIFAVPIERERGD